MTLTRQDLHPQAVRVLLAILSHPGPYAPTVRELGAATGLSSSASVHDHLRTLRRRGLVDWEDGKKGTLRALVAPAGVGQAHVHHVELTPPGMALARGDGWA